MAFSFAKRYNIERKFDIDTSDFDYCSLEELYNEIGGDEECAFEICGVYINNSTKFENKQGVKEAPILALKDRYVNLPAHLTPTCKAMLEDKNCINAINEGKCGFTIYRYIQKRFGTECYGVKWVDL